MTPQPPPKPDNAPAAPHEATGTTTAAGTSLTHQFMSAFQKTVRSANLYNKNNQLLAKFQADTYALFEALTAQIGDIELGVRADKLLIGREVVLTDTDREVGLPFRLFRESVRRLTLLAGMPAEEMTELVAIFAARGTQDDDLVTLLWRAALPHVKYVTVDISSAAYTPAGAGKEAPEDEGDTGIREELNNLLSAIYRGGNEEASVRGISIGADDLLALKALGSQREVDVGTLAHQTARELFPVDPGTLAATAAEAENETDAALMDRALDVLLAVLFAVRTGAETRRVIDQLLGLYDSLLLSRDFRGAAGLVDRVRMHGGTVEGATDPELLKAITITRSLVKQFLNEQRLTSIVVALNEMVQASPADLARLWSSLGADDPGVLLTMLPGIQNPQQRRLLCDTLVGNGLPKVAQMAPYLNNQEWFVGRDILYLLSKSSDPEAQALLLGACDNPHPRLRHGAISSLGPLPPGEADQKIIRALTDDDAQVRQAAVRLAGARKLARAVDVLEGVIGQDDFGDRDLGEIKSYLMAFAVLGGERAVPALERILNPPILSRGSALFDRLRSSVESAADSQKVDLRIAAAHALGALDGPQALAALQKGARSVISPVKHACQKALGRGDGDKGGHQ